MARPLRIELAGGLYHVTARGDGRDDIYFSDGDREAWLSVFAEVCGRFNWICHARQKARPDPPPPWGEEARVSRCA